MTMLTETRERFLLAIAAQIPAERIAEIHFFSPIKQGGVESGVAVVVERGERREESGEIEAETPEDETPEFELASPDSPLASSIASPDSPLASERYVVHTARYRLTLKGIDRGKWEASVFAEADAPLATVDAVVRGVQRRSGDVDDATRMEGDEARALLEAKAAVGTRSAP